MKYVIILQGIIEYTVRANPYAEVGTIHNAGLNYIIANTGAIPKLTTDFIQANYATYVTYDAANVSTIATTGFNLTTDNAYATLAGIDLNGGANSYVMEVFNFIDAFPPFVYPTTRNSSYLIFNDSYETVLAQNFVNLLNRILDSGLPADQQILPLVALAVFKSSYEYWKAVYNNSGGSNPWYTSLNSIIGDINNIDWRQLIQQDIKGALAGAVAGGVNSPGNVEGGIIVGAATAGIAASAQNLFAQAAMVSVFDPA